MFPKNALADPATMQQLHWHGDPIRIGPLAVACSISSAIAA